MHATNPLHPLPKSVSYHTESESTIPALEYHTILTDFHVYNGSFVETLLYHIITWTSRGFDASFRDLGLFGSTRFSMLY